MQLMEQQIAPWIIGGGYKKPRWSSSSGSAMDPALWSTLPDDVLDRILAWLPVDALFRMRTLCRRWFKITSCRSFKDLCSSVPLFQFAFVSTTGCGCGCQQRVLRTLLLSTSSSPGRWVRIPLSFLHPSAAGVAVTSSNGLVVISNSGGTGGWDEQQSASPLVVCNPLTRTSRELPPMLLHHRPAVLAMAATSSGEYKIVAAGRWTTEVYDSVVGCWRRCGCLPRGEEASRNVVVVGGVLYCLTPRWYNCSLLAFSLEREIWSKVKTGRLPGYCQFRNLVDCGGRVAIVGKCVRHQVFTVCVWLLEEASPQSAQQQQQLSQRKWREAGRMPRTMAEHFLVTPSEGFHCAATAGLVLLTRDNSHDGVLFDLASQSWSWVPGCPGRETIGFEPRLDAAP